MDRPVRLRSRAAGPSATIVSLALGVACALAALPDARSAQRPQRAVLEAINRERAQRGLPPATEPSDLRRIAERRATEIAGMSPRDRMDPHPSIKDYLLRQGLTDFTVAREHLLTLRGFSDPAREALNSWRSSGEAWDAALAARTQQISIGWAEAEDGTQVVVGILLEPLRRFSAEELGDIERATFDAVNDIRRRRGLRVLRWNRRLAEVARAHSLDMARRNYFDHVNPEGEGPAQRVRRARLAYRAVAENLAQNRGADDPVATAVEGWMNSRGHRENILEPVYEQGAMGVVMDAGGEIFFTQLFYTPRQE